MKPIKYTMDLDAHDELKELLEDTVQHFCDEWMISGELSWLVIHCISKGKMNELRGK